MGRVVNKDARGDEKVGKDAEKDEKESKIAMKVKM